MNTCDTTTTIDRSACPGRRHGTMRAYTHHGCRCPDARHIASITRKRRRAGHRAAPRHTDATGTARRLQALAARGWSIPSIARWLDCDTGRVWQMQHRYYPTILITTAQTVADLYSQLADTIGPSQRARDAAATNNWDGPDAWWFSDIDNPHAHPDRADPDDQLVDEVVVERLIHGDMPPSQATTAERHAAARALAARGASINRIASRAGVSGTTAHRLLAA
jgi:hypothetical protein